MPNKFGKAVRKLKKSRAAERQQISGLLGVIRGGAQVVEVTDRNSFVWVRLRGRVSELIQAFNDAVSPVYNLPVIVERDRTNPSRYRVVSRDVGRYGDWGSFSAYLPNHGNAHSFRDDGAGGGDIVWTYSRQFMPGLVSPSGSAGGMNVEVREFSYYQNSTFCVVGNTGTASLLPYKPTGSSANVTLVYLDTDTGNPMLAAGSSFASSITGSAEVAKYLPAMADEKDIPLAGIRLISGSSYVGWDNIYDFREFIRPVVANRQSTYFRAGAPTALTTITGTYWQVPDRVYATGSLSAFQNGLALSIGIDYQEQHAVSGTFQYLTIPPTGTTHYVLYGVPV